MDTNKMRDLKALAESATPGQWVTDGEYVNEHGNVLYGYVAHEDSGLIAQAFANCLVKTDEQCRANAAFIAAANPSTVLVLLAENERLTSQVKTLQSDANSWQSGYDEGRRMGTKTAYSERAQLKSENEALRKEREGMVLVPAAPSEGLLMSMAIRQDHGLGVPGYYDQPLMQRANHGVSHARMVECALSDMRKLHEEVVGAGFYLPEKDADYAAMAKEAPHE